MSLEVEKKFVFNADTEENLRKLGAAFLGEQLFKDRYFDTEDFSLTLKDVWLRRRGDNFELKCPVGRDKQNKTDTCTRYRELTALPLIQAHIQQLLEPNGIKKEGTGHMHAVDRTLEKNNCGLTKGQAEEGTSGSWLNEFGLVEFAVFSTVRRTFTLPDTESIHIDLDYADFGFLVGELEVLVKTEEQIPEALTTIKELAEKLGVSNSERVPGKMDAYLQRFCPDHYQRLLEAHVLHR
ncbi:THTPA triphosphatase, partial [Polypterus senegalus]|nr:thiamine-triphosphatase [Polypterus senegalus]XP_039603381.1 thiamine-triphosphatase [Polypterus senegalus]MBN3291241.1 THTPA triphosphatase [Polypterus senegalus]